MCVICKDSIHDKFKNVKDHKVIDLKEVGLYREEPDFSNLECECHPNKFCTTCDKLVCVSCITKFHTGHTFVEISEGYELKVEKIKTETTKAKKELRR